MLGFAGVYQQAVWVYLGLFFLLLYNYLVFILVGNILEHSRLRAFSRLLISVMNTIIFYIFISFKDVSTIFFYVALFLLLLTEFYLLHKDRIARVLFVTLACITHVMVLRSVCVAILAMVLNTTFYKVSNSIGLLWESTALTALCVDAAIVMVLKLIPKEKLKIIVQHKEQLVFLSAWLSVNNICLLIFARVYSIHGEYSFLNVILIIAPLAILIGTYIVLFFSIKTTELLGYKVKNAELELEVQKQQQYRQSMLAGSISSFEANLSKNEIILGFDEYDPKYGDYEGVRYNQVLNMVAQRYVFSDDLIAFIEHTNSAGMIGEFKKGRSEINLEYRRLMVDGTYIWVRATTNLMQDIVTGDIKSFTYIKNIDDEKKAQIELEYKAEKDVLTGLYNKATTIQLISSYLYDPTDKNKEGVLFMIDVDNFKSINDSLGHVYGDTVLHGLSEKLSNIFGAQTIVGRLGGDEFMVFMKGAYNRKEIEDKAMEVCDSFYQMYFESGKEEHRVSGSVGISNFPFHGESFEELYKKADIALYLSKNKGKNTYSIYGGELFTAYQSDREEGT